MIKNMTGSCSPEVTVSPELQQLAATVTEETEEQKTSRTMGITIEKLKAMRQYLALLKRSEPGIKDKTLRIKVWEKFKIKLK